MSAVLVTVIVYAAARDYFYIAVFAYIKIVVNKVLYSALGENYGNMDFFSDSAVLYEPLA